jgi:hypothetical protein
LNAQREEVTGDVALPGKAANWFEAAE